MATGWRARGRDRASLATPAERYDPCVHIVDGRARLSQARCICHGNAHRFAFFARWDVHGKHARLVAAAHTCTTPLVARMVRHVVKKLQPLIPAFAIENASGCVCHGHLHFPTRIARPTTSILLYMLWRATARPARSGCAITNEGGRAEQWRIVACTRVVSKAGLHTIVFVIINRNDIYFVVE